MSHLNNELTLAVADLDEQAVLALVQERLDAGQDALAVLDLCRRGMAIVGEQFQAGDYFFPYFLEMVTTLGRT